MPAYLHRTLRAFVTSNPTALLGRLEAAYAEDGFVSLYTRQTKAWETILPTLQLQLKTLLDQRPDVGCWALMLEYPLYRLRRRIDLVILAGQFIVVVECKVGADEFSAIDCRQVEEYALDLRDFHAESHGRQIIPVLWSTDAPQLDSRPPSIEYLGSSVASVIRVGAGGIAPFLASLKAFDSVGSIVAKDWDRSPYRPIPSVIEAATMMFAGHGVQSITNADAENLRDAAERLIELIEQARERRKRYLLFLSGVPGSGKTLAGLHVVHSAVATGVENEGDIVYLSGNTPLVVVLREALARDQHARYRHTQKQRPLEQIRRKARTRIQHINDFLHESLRGNPHKPPHEHVIVFDEAQRAWDEKQGQEKFDRTSSEPFLILDLMSRHRDWCACVCLIGGGQEINSGEQGVLGWGEALRKLPPHDREKWAVFAPPDVVSGGPSTGTFTLGEIPPNFPLKVEENLQLRVPQRTYRSPSVSRWVDFVLAGDPAGARSMAESFNEFSIVMTRSLLQAKTWLRDRGRGERRFGLVASSGARRLRADGLGTFLHPSAGSEIAQWYLNPPGDIRSSFALEVPANEYTCQGLELDLVCLCWGGDLLWDSRNQNWRYLRLSGTRWQRVGAFHARRFLENSYRVLLTRARQGMVLWVPSGDESDDTRSPGPLDATADYLAQCGASLLRS